MTVLRFLRRCATALALLALCALAPGATAALADTGGDGVPPAYRCPQHCPHPTPTATAATPSPEPTRPTPPPCSVYGGDYPCTPWPPEPSSAMPTPAQTPMPTPTPTQPSASPTPTPRPTHSPRPHTPELAHTGPGGAALLGLSLAGITLSAIGGAAVVYARHRRSRPGEHRA